MKKIPDVTVHGRFQPPLHINHERYVMDAFDIADKVTILITNPFLNETEVKEASHRNNPSNNPFTYNERVKIFQNYFKNKGIEQARYEFKPFDITDLNNWENVLNKNVPNLVNTYSPWSWEKLKKFKGKGLKVIHKNRPKIGGVSGTGVRRILNETISAERKKEKLLKYGYVEEALEGLTNVLKDKISSNNLK